MFPSQALLGSLFAGFELPESNENEYLMKAVMRVIGFVGPAIAPVSGVCLHKLAAMLLEVRDTPGLCCFSLGHIRACAA